MANLNNRFEGKAFLVLAQLMINRGDILKS
jgi:hypothetical protein